MRDSLAAALTVLVLCLGAASPALAARKPKPPAAAPAKAPEPPQPPTGVAAQLAEWVTASGDNHGQRFAIIDKVAARVFVFDGSGALAASAPVLVGAAVGDGSTPGVGDREISDIPPDERTTPAGRFVVGYAPAKGGKDVLWVDYANGISMHPVVTSHPKERRPQRLKSPTPDDNRITYGCINVAATFYNKVVRPAFSQGSGVVYILPETRPLDEVFPRFAAESHASQPDVAAAPEVASAPDVAAAPANDGNLSP